jgi:hypothetical protein
LTDPLTLTYPEPELSMQRTHVLLLATMSLTVLACGDTALEPMAPNAEPSFAAAAAGPVDVSGTYQAVVDFSTLTLTPRGRNCRLVVDGMLVLSGTIEGTATGTTTALVFAPCSEVATTPPGTYRDVFTSELHFVGTVDGEPAEADGLYQGTTQVGGAIEGHLHFFNGVAGVLDVDAIVAVGGSYEGTLVVR